MVKEFGVKLITPPNSVGQKALKKSLINKFENKPTRKFIHTLNAIEISQLLMCGTKNTPSLLLFKLLIF